MKGPADMRVMTQKSFIIVLLLSLLIFIAGPIPQTLAQDAATGKDEASGEASYGPRMSLLVFLDNAGKALVTGYAESADDLDFLNNTDFRFENDTRQLYALTDRLTEKSGDLWTLKFSTEGSFDDYHVTFYLPKETSLGEINASRGLSYLLYASNESIVADVQGYEVSNPQINISYRQPLSSNSGGLPPVPPLGGQPPTDSTILILIIVAAALLIAGFVTGVIILRRRSGKDGGSNEEPLPVQFSAAANEADSGRATEALKPGSEIEQVYAGQESAPQEPVVRPSGAEYLASVPGSGSADMPESMVDLGFEAREETGAETGADAVQEGNSPTLTESPSHIEERCEDEGESRISSQQSVEAPPEAEAEPEASASFESGIARSGSKRESIAISSEMKAVIETLTPRERAVISTLIDHGARMTQADIRYETGTPKSSLTGILISLERRKLVTKKEWGRTNIIELSEWFLSKKEHS